MYAKKLSKVTLDIFKRQFTTIFTLFEIIIKNEQNWRGTPTCGR